VAFGDVDGDGDLDLAVGSGGGQNVVYLNTLVRCVYLPNKDPWGFGNPKGLTSET
jgi:hypothetical protein